ncbi:MAG: hypothetical protein OXR66_00995 [Candidatus Woesearchaeota archaeon]|nr:hypothetical protein [Candidatus Woesearchaeota archaeon]
MEELSNRVIAVLLVVSMVVSCFGIFATFTGSPTGFALVDTGKTNFSISTALSITFENALVPFGSGYVNGSYTSCSMGTNNSPPNRSANSGCVDFNGSVHEANLTITNDGNLVANVSLNFTGDADSFIGGTGGLNSYQYEVSNVSGEASCTTLGNGSSFREVADYDVNGTNARVCTGLDYPDGQDTIQVGVWIQVPEDATSGEHASTITAIACDDGSC